MSYKALYRSYRPQTFEEVAGQEHVVTTLQNAIKENRISHAYLFAGPRGTGKTTVAKLLAKALNCTGECPPCDTCPNCKAISAGEHPDVIEIDAASNNGVDEVRDLIDKVKYAPINGKYKVYIIDEVHMLSTGAFNALLKTLEEPPQNVIFILATTEPHKIPLTIISRTQRFDFKRISTQDIVDHMAHIMQEMALDYEEQALYVIGRAAEGGMRDALSILDQTISFSDEKVTLEDAMQVTGSLTYEMMDHYIQCCVAGDVERALEGLESILGEGKEARRFLEDLLLYCRDLLMYQQAPKLLAEKAGTLTEAFKELATQTPAEKIYQLIQILSDTQNEIRFTNNANIYLEVATVKLAKTVQPNKHNTPETANQDGSAEGNPELADLQNQIGQLKKELAELKKHGVAAKEADAPRQQARPQASKSSFRVPTERVYQVLNEATRTHLMNVKNVWEDLLQTLSVTQRAMLKASEPVAASPKGIVVAFDYEIVCARATDDEEMQLAFNNNLSRLMDYTPEMVCITRESWPKLRQSFINQNQGSLNHSEPENEMARLADEPPVTNEHSQENPVVDEAIAMFGEELVEVLDD